MRKLVVIVFGAISALSFGQEGIEFEGIPSTRVERRADYTSSEIITGLERQSSSVRITKSGDSYFWASRNDIPMIKISDGIYVTYLALDGSGYVRTLNQVAREVYQSQALNTQIGQTMYVEHILIGLESLTFYGR